MSNEKYLKEGTLEVVTILGVYKKQTKAVEKELKRKNKQIKRMDAEFEEILEDAKNALDLHRKQADEKDQSIKTLREIIKRASAGLSRDKTENTEGLKPEDVKAILEETLKAWENEK